MDLPTLKRLWARDRPAIVTSLGNDAILRAAGIPAPGLHSDAGVTALDWGDDTTVGTRRMAVWQREGAHGAAPMARVTVTRNHHWGSRWFSDRNRALWSAFVVDMPAGGSIFFAGDTGLGDGKWPAEARAAALGPFRLAILPIGAFRFVPGQMRIGSHMGPVEAVRAFDALGATTALPVHWGTFRLSYEGYDTPPILLALLMRCTGADPARFAAHGIGAAFEVPGAGAGAGAMRPLDLTRLDACANSEAVRALP